MKTSADGRLSKLKTNTLMVDNLNANAKDSKGIQNRDVIGISTNDISNGTVEENENVFITDSQSCLAANENENDSLSLVLRPGLKSQVLLTPPKTYIPSNRYASCRLLDFDGNKEFYATNQTFLTRSAVYLIVADIDDDIVMPSANNYFADFHIIRGKYDICLPRRTFMHL